MKVAESRFNWMHFVVIFVESWERTAKMFYGRNNNNIVYDFCPKGDVVAKIVW